MGKKENCLYLQVAHCNKCGGESGYNIYDGEKVCFDCGEPYKADFSVSKVESTITTTNTQPQAGGDEDCIVISRKEFEDKLLDREREAQIEVLTDIFQTCYQEDSKTLELVEEKLSKLTTK